MSKVVGFAALVFALCFFLLSSTVHAAQDQYISTSGVGITFVGAAPKFKVQKIVNGTLSNTKSFMVTMGDITENEVVSSPGQQNKVTSLASQNFVWTSKSATYNGHNATVISLTANVTVATGTAKVNITTYLVSGSATFQNGNETVSVDGNVLKFSVEVASWPFRNSNNTLSVAIGVSNMEGTFESNSLVANYTDGSYALVEMSGVAFVDNVLKKVTPSYTNKEFTVTFPSFTNAVLYDPVIGFVDATPSTSPTPRPSPSSGSTLGVLVGYLVLALLALYM